MKRPQDALASYEKALAIAPDDARSLGNRTSLLQKLKASAATPHGAAPVEKKKMPMPAAAAGKAKSAKKKSTKTRGR